MYWKIFSLLGLWFCITTGSHGNLPHGWTEHIWEGRPYYFNHLDGTSTWIHPLQQSSQTAAPANTPVESIPFMGPRHEPFTPQDQQSQPSPKAEVVEQSKPFEHQSYDSLSLQKRLSQLEGETELLRGALNDALRLKDGAESERDNANTELRLAFEQKQLAQDESAQIRGYLQGTQSENEELKAEVDLQHRLQRNLTARVEDLELVKLRLEAQVFNLTTLYESTCDKSRALIEEEETNERELQEAVARRDELERMLEDALDEISAIDKERQNLQFWLQSSTRPSLFKRIFEEYVVALVPENLRKPSQVEQSLAELTKKAEALQANNTLLIEMLDSKDGLIDELNMRISGFEHNSLKRKRKFKQLKEEVTELTEILSSKDAEIAKIKEEGEKYLQEAVKRNTTIAELQKKLEVMIDDNILMEQQIAELSSKISMEIDKLSAKDKQVQKFEALTNEQNQTIIGLNSSLLTAMLALEEAKKNYSEKLIEIQREAVSYRIANEQILKKLNQTQAEQIGSAPNSTSPGGSDFRRNDVSKKKRKWFCCF